MIMHHTTRVFTPVTAKSSCVYEHVGFVEVMSLWFSFPLYSRYIIQLLLKKRSCVCIIVCLCLCVFLYKTEGEHFLL